MKRLGVKTAILSCTAPGACIFTEKKSFNLARMLNLYAAELRDAQPGTFGFFASLPSLIDTNAALEELNYSFDTLKADGAVVFTRYGTTNTYLGSPALEPIWAELHRRKAVVFVHPTQSVDTNKVNPRLVQPEIGSPDEMARAAMDMITMGTLQKYPDCKVILSHTGGSLPYIISRIAMLLLKGPHFAALHVAGITHEIVMQDFRSMYYDIAFSSSPQALDFLFKMVPHDHILFGVGRQCLSLGKIANQYIPPLERLSLRPGPGVPRVSRGVGKI
jgi:predicted TIM-barrel fold metal-dependent hydrolase